MSVKVSCLEWGWRYFQLCCETSSEKCVKVGKEIFHDDNRYFTEPERYW